MSEKLLVHIWTYAPILIDFKMLIGQISIFLDTTLNVCKVGINCKLSVI